MLSFLVGKVWIKGCSLQFAPTPLIQPVDAQNGGFSYLQEKALERILKIVWFEHLAHTIPPAPISLARS